MEHRFLAWMGVVVAIAVVALASVACQAPKAAPSLKTSWGEPDLQGIWTDDYQTPLQRSAKYAGREFLTDAEIAELDKQRASLPGNESRTVRGTQEDVAGAYNAVFQFRKHTGRRTSLIVDPPDGRVPSLTPEVQKRQQEWREFFLALVQSTNTCKNKLRGCEGGKYDPKPSPRRAEPLKFYPAANLVPGGGHINRSDGPEERGLSERCLTAILPDFTGFRQIVQSPQSVSIFYDTGQGQGWHRSIPVDGGPHLPQSIRLWWGDSRGHWEGNTLVVDVTNFSPKTEFQGSRENLHLIERWTRTGPDTLEYVVTMDDKMTWTKSWTVKQEYRQQSDQYNRVYKEPRCHEGNFAMIGMLSGARAMEMAFAEGRGPDPATINLVTPTNSANSPEELDPLGQ
ncbi:MAG: hypothetical protein DMF92_20435 [Acidobacteria bacterium]|nr:MAG: hypothetical protein DMF92_20435 [Acidobacteriota bacterium]